MNKILLIDDEIDICLLLSSILQREGFQTAYALSLNEARNKLSQEEFGAVFVDLNLPDGVGYQIIPVIKEAKSQTKIIVVSAYDAERKKAVLEGADYFIAKPFNRKSVITALKQLNFINISKIDH